MLTQIQSIGRLKSSQIRQLNFNDSLLQMKDTFSAMKVQMDELVGTLEENVVQMEAMKAELQLVQDNMAAEESRADFAESQLHILVQRQLLNYMCLL